MPVAHGLDMRTLFPPRSDVLAPPLHVPLLSQGLRARAIESHQAVLVHRVPPQPAAAPADKYCADELDSWIKRIFLQLRELELRLIMGSLQGSLANALA